MTQNHKKIILSIAPRSSSQEISDRRSLESKYSLIAAKDSKTGLKIVKEKNIDLILWNVKSAKAKEYEALKQLRQDPATATIPVILLDDKINISEWRKAMSKGADDYLCREDIVEITKAIATQFKKQAGHQQRLAEELEHLHVHITESIPHELRAPLTSILAASDFLNASDIPTLEPEIIAEMLGCIKLSADRLNRLIKNFLLYSQLKQLSNDPQQIEKLRNSQTLSVEAVIQKTATKQAQKAQREADLHLEIEDASVQIATKNLGKMVEEIIDNACKFSTPGTPICVTTSLKCDRIIVSVSDRGRGMTPRQITRIGPYVQFDRFTHEQQGVGLGLTIAKHLAELHQGQLSIESIPAKATTVSISLPKVSEYSMAAVN